MATDLKEKQRTSIEREASAVQPIRMDPRWPYAATAIVLAVLAVVTVLVLAQGATPAGPEQWQPNVGGMMTEVREGSGFATVEGAPHTQPSRRYANGALEGEIRETPADPSVSYLEGAFTDTREGS